MGRGSGVRRIRAATAALFFVGAIPIAAPLGGVALAAESAAAEIPEAGLGEDDELRGTAGSQGSADAPRATEGAAEGADESADESSAESPGLPSPAGPGLPSPEGPGLPSPAGPGLPSADAPAPPSPEGPGLPSPEAPGQRSPDHTDLGTSEDEDADQDADQAQRLEPRLGFGGELRLGASVHQPAVSVALSGDYSWRRASLGAGVELNPYFGVGGGDVVAGALHIFATGEHRVPLGRVVLRQRVNVGPAILLVDVLGHDRGSLGLFLEAVPLGLELQTRARRVAVLLEAFSLALSAPGLGLGVDGAAPLVRYQYRGAVGLRF